MNLVRVLVVAAALTTAAGTTVVSSASLAQRSSSFTVEQILSLPTPDNLTASPVGSMIAWTFSERGVRNVFLAEGPDFKPRQATAFKEDDGQELTNLSFTPDGKALMFVRGGDHGSARPGDAPNPSAAPQQPRVQIWMVPIAGGPARRLADGDDPVLAPDGQSVAFLKDRRIWIASLNGSVRPLAVFSRGTSESPAWSPDGRTLAFASGRGDHSFIGLYRPEQNIRYVSPSTFRDSDPVWSVDGRRLAFLRQPGSGGNPRALLDEPQLPWSIMVADVDDHGDASPAATALTSGDSPVDPILRHPGRMNFQWGAEDTLVFLMYRDGWPHLYALEHPGRGGPPLLLTPGAFMVEQFTLVPDGRSAIFTANTGSDPADFDRRHLFKVPINAASPAALTAGTSIDWSPTVTGDGKTVVYLSADPRRPPLPAAVALSGGDRRLIAANHLPADFPVQSLVTPQAVSFPATDGVEAHGQLFTPTNTAGRRPAVVYIHGGGPRQMLLGWHTRWEYANDYAANQYLVNHGFIVLSVDYRLSVGYGQAFQFPQHAGPRGAAEYLDVLAAGQYLQRRADVDPRRIGVWGASLGGYLTAMALGRNSDVFAAGVDIHGVHDRLGLNPAQLAHAIVGDGISEADLRQALKTEFDSSPISTIATWRSPVLLIHGDDDRTVDFHQTVDLERRLIDKGIHVETVILPDDVHDSLLWRNWKLTITAMAEFFERTLQ